MGGVGGGPTAMGGVGDGPTAIGGVGGGPTAIGGVGGGPTAIGGVGGGGPAAMGGAGGGPERIGGVGGGIGGAPAMGGAGGGIGGAPAMGGVGGDIGGAPAMGGAGGGIGGAPAMRGVDGGTVIEGVGGGSVPDGCDGVGGGAGLASSAGLIDDTEPVAVRAPSPMTCPGRTGVSFTVAISELSAFSRCAARRAASFGSITRESYDWRASGSAGKADVGCRAPRGNATTSVKGHRSFVHNGTKTTSQPTAQPAPGAMACGRRFPTAGN